MKTWVHSKEEAVPDERLEDTSSAQVDDKPLSWTSLGDSAGPSSTLVTSLGDALVDEGAKALKPRLSPVKVHMLTLAAGS